jgi:hypothetical protein
LILSLTFWSLHEKTPFDSHSSMVEVQRSQLLKKYHRPWTLVI